MSTEKLIRSIAPEVRVVDAKEGLVDYVASDETVDCYAEVIAAKGWRFSRFEKNAPFVDSHDYWSIDKLLGRVESFAVQGRKLIERVRWARGASPLADLGWKLTEGGFLKAVSVGFYAVRSILPGDPDWQKTCTDMGIGKDDAQGVRRIFLEQEQIELSACIIGANPNALARAHQDGCVRDEDLARCGFADEDMDFLQLAGKAMENPDTDPLMRSMIEREMRRLGKSDFRKRGDSPAPSASKPAGADEDAKRQAERERFLKQLRAL